MFEKPLQKPTDSLLKHAIVKSSDPIPRIINSQIQEEEKDENSRNEEMDN